MHKRKQKKKLNKTKTYLQGNQILLHTLLSIICAAVKLSISANLWESRWKISLIAVICPRTVLFFCEIVFFAARHYILLVS